MMLRIGMEKSSILRRSCLLLLAFVVSVYLVKRRTNELWDEQAAAASNLFRPIKTTNATLWQKTKEILACSSSSVCRAAGKRRWITDAANSNSCPAYFNWVAEDLKPWRQSGISLDMLLAAQKRASFRLIILNGRLFIESYRKSFQTRDLFTIWGFAQLLKYYPGMVPDVDLMFICDDTPVISHQNHATSPPPLFRYCGSQSTFDIAFPDWSFWGWPEVRIPPWEGLVKEIQNGSLDVEWADRDPTAYWKGNPYVSRGRQDLLKCNLSNTHDWNARLYIQDWRKESMRGFRDSKLSKQCNHRYKIYIEGAAWSVSLKYILACDSPTLMVTPRFHDFFLRGLAPQHHYWPLRASDTHKQCQSIKFAVDWGNNHTQEARAIGIAGRDFALNELTMSNVYSYMLHVLREYAKLLKYKPSVTARAAEYCSETILCLAKQLEKEYMKDSMVKAPSASPPCNLENEESRSKSIKDLFDRKLRSMGHIHDLEDKAWASAV
eukprot:Gb_34473 [translate_table: standard]